MSNNIMHNIIILNYVYKYKPLLHMYPTDIYNMWSLHECPKVDTMPGHNMSHKHHMQ